MVHNRRTGSQSDALERPVSREKLERGTPFGWSKAPTERPLAAVHGGKPVTSLALPLYHTPPRFYKAK